MAFYADLAPCDYFGPDFAPALRAVGWLEAGRDYRRGSVEPRLVHKLALLLSEPWEHERSVDPHACSLCPFTGGPAEFRLARADGMPAVPLGNRNLYVPGPDVLYVVPSFVLHYVDAHGYAPPEAFAEAVWACPPVRSREYAEAVRRLAPPGLLKA